MRLKAKVTQAGLFLRVVQTVEKINKECVFHLTPRKVQFILASDNITDGVQVWSGLNAQTLFGEYKIESLNNNEISFKLNLDNLHRALKSAQYATDVLMKLTKKNNLPYLNFTVSTQTSQVMVVVQEVPVELLSAGQLAQYVEPHLPDPEVHIMMPQSLNKNVSDHLIINANMGGELSLSVEESMVKITTFYKNLSHPAIGIVKDRAVVLHVMLQDLYLTYYIPVITKD